MEKWCDVLVFSSLKDQSRCWVHDGLKTP